MRVKTATDTATRWVGFGMRALPLPIIDMALRRLTAKILAGHPQSFSRMAPYASTIFLIEPLDLPVQFRIRLDSPAPITCQRRPTPCAWNARVAGPISSFLAMAHGTLDGDALFFSREITIEGDTDAILAMRNAIDAAEIDLPFEVAGLFGPLAPPARRALHAAAPLARRMLDIATTARGVHAT